MNGAKRDQRIYIWCSYKQICRTQPRWNVLLHFNGYKCLYPVQTVCFIKAKTFTFLELSWPFCNLLLQLYKSVLFLKLKLIVLYQLNVFLDLISIWCILEFKISSTVLCIYLPNFKAITFFLTSLLEYNFFTKVC